MAKRTLERILQTIVNIKKGSILSKPTSKILEKLPDLSREEVAATVDYLVELGHLQAGGGDDLSHVIVNSSAIVYLKQLEEDATFANRKKWEDRSWSLLQMLLGGIVGSVLTILIQHLLKSSQ